MNTPGPQAAPSRETPRRQRHAPAQARAVILWALGGFFLTQLASRAAIENWLPWLRDPNFEVKVRQLQKNLELASEKPFTIVFLGSSQTSCCLKAQRLSETLTRELGRPVLAYNLGTPGSGPFTYLLNLNRLLRRGLKPDLVVLEAAPRHLADSGTPWDVGHFPPEVLAYRDVGLVKRYGAAKAQHTRREWWQNFFVPAYAHRQGILTAFAPNLLPHSWRANDWPTIDAAGWFPFPLKVDNAQEHERLLAGMRKNLGPMLANFRHGGDNFRAMQEALGRGKRAGIAMLVWITPEGPAMRELYRPGSFEAFRAALDEQCFHLNYPLIDAWEWCPEEDFADSYHLLPGTADALTDRLSGELSRLLQAAP